MHCCEKIQVTVSFLLVFDLNHSSVEEWYLIVRECLIAAARSVMFQGFTKIAPAPKDWAAPANSLKTRTPENTAAG